MNRVNSLVQQQMMASRRSPSFWMPPLTSQEMEFNTSPSSLSSAADRFPRSSKAMIPNFHELPAESWSQLLLGRFIEEEEGCTTYSSIINSHSLSVLGNGGHVGDDVIKQEDNHYNFQGKDQAEAQATAAVASRSHPWSDKNTAAGQVGSSPRSCLSTTSFSSSNNNSNMNNSNSILDFSDYKSCRQQRYHKHHHESNHYSSDQCNRYNGSALKKARIQPFSAESYLKVRKEKLGDRIAALHQLVSPFGKTDTASVLLEAIGYIRFLHNQVEALSSPYLGGGSTKKVRHSVSSRV